jgi:8-oxo-dGTP pyrophosphatase MutT (NUDIX family)
MGDALAVALLDARGFKPEDFARSHPGGSLGRKLLTHVADVMRKGADVPQVGPDAEFTALMREMSSKGLGATSVTDADGRVLIAQRPAGKPMAGLWECPGGKIGAGETPERALVRELKEEGELPPNWNMTLSYGGKVWHADRAVDRLYRPSGFASDRERVEHLFTLYEAMAAPLLAGRGAARRGRKPRPVAG